MKKTFTILIAALAAILMMAQPMKAVGQKTTYEYVLVTNISQLSQGDVVLITNSKSNGNQYALGTTQNNNNRKAESVSISDNVISTLGNAQEITLETKDNNGKFTFKVGANSYLYAANSSNGSSNYLRSKNDDAIYWQITINTTSHVAGISDETSSCNGRKHMKYNYNSGNPIFSCYASSDNNLFVFKKQESGGGSTPTITLTEGEPDFTLGTVEAGIELNRTFTVAQENLSVAISLSTTVGSLSQSSVAQGAATTTVTWTYTPSAAGEISGTITASSTGAESKTIAITGTAAAFYDVTFDAGDGTFDGNAEFPDESGNHVVAGSHTLPSAIPADGYQFDGWIATGVSEPVTGSYNITGSIDFTASYSEYTGPKVSYNFTTSTINSETVATNFYTTAQKTIHAAINVDYDNLYYENGDVFAAGSTTQHQFRAGYYFLGKTNSYLQFPEFDFDVEKIEIVGRNGASTSVKQNIYVGDVAVSTETTGCTGTNTYIISDAYQAAGNVYTLKVTSNANTQITAINIYEKKAGSVSQPTLPASCSFTGNKEITITGPEGATIRYTTDGSSPQINTGTVYENPFNINTTTTIKAIAIINNVSSTIAEATYTRLYDIVLTQTVGGVISASPTQAAAGTTITLTATPNVGYTFGSWSVSPTVTINDNSFTMPANDVAVSASFSEASGIYTVSFNVNNKVEMTATINAGTSLDLTKFVADVKTEGYQWDGWYTSTSGGDKVTGSYTPLANTTLYAQFSEVQSSDYTLVTNVNQLVSGDNIIIAAHSTTNVAMSTTQNTNNRGVAIIQKNNNNTLTIVDDPTDAVVCELTLGVSNNHWTFYDAVNSGYLYAVSGNNYLRTQETNDANGEWSISISNNEATITAQGTNTNTRVLKYNSNNSIFACYTSGQQTVWLYRKPASSKGTRDGVEASSKITGIDAIVQVTVKTNGKVYLTGSNAGNANNLIVEDGGQLVSSNNVAATFQKSITQYTGNKDNYYLIAAPFAVTPGEVSGMLDDEYDLYYFDQDHNAEEWRNYKTFENGFSMYKASGYLYANSVSKTLEFAGTASKDQNTTKKLKKTDGKPFSGFNLVGNPLAVNITSLKVGESEISYYMLTSSGTFTATTATIAPIKVCEGFMVQAIENDQIMSINTASKDFGYNNDEIIRIEVANSQYQDVAYVRFGSSMPLNKINHINDEAPMLYINNNDADYAVAVLNNRAEVKCLNVNFKAKTMGTYTISAKAENNNISYMHLIDRLTGADIDLLNDSYSFIGSKSDIAERFILRFEATGNGNDNEIFAFQNGSDIIVNGEGELQIFDVMGRMVKNTTINGVEAIAMPQGVYIFRLNENIQKIVVR